jgi:hypothetical protein
MCCVRVWIGVSCGCAVCGLRWVLRWAVGCVACGFVVVGVWVLV